MTVGRCYLPRPMPGPNPRAPHFVAAGDDDALRLPDGQDLSQSLRFSPREGRIVLGEERVVLFHVQALAELRRGLIDTFGVEQARAMLTRVGYASGYRDAEHARRLRGDASAYELLAAGPQLHALEGMAQVTPIEVRFDIERGHYHGEFAWRNSAEADAHLRISGVSPEPVCWTMIGYASGYTSAFMGRPIVYREFDCRACGARRCRLVGKPLQAWDPLPPEYAFLSAEPLAATPGEAPTELQVATEEALVGVSPAFRGVWSHLERVAATDTLVLLCGESGTGKDTLARLVHARSRRAGGPLVKAACRTLMTSGEVAGLAAAARGGTLVVDAIEALPQALQAELVEAIDAAEDLRVIACSEHDLLHEPWAGRLLPALLHRVAVFPLHLPTLRERRDDLPSLIRALLERHAGRLGRRVKGMTARATAALLDHDYPGNIRELSNLIERAVVLVGDDAVIDVGHLFGGRERAVGLLGIGVDGTLRSTEPGPAPARETMPADALVARLLEEGTSLEGLEAALIRGAVERAAGNLSQAARTLGLTRPQLAYRFRKIAEDG